MKSWPEMQRERRALQYCDSQPNKQQNKQVWRREYLLSRIVVDAQTNHTPSQQRCSLLLPFWRLSGLPLPREATLAAARTTPRTVSHITPHHIILSVLSLRGVSLSPHKRHPRHLAQRYISSCRSFPLVCVRGLSGLPSLPCAEC